MIHGFKVVPYLEVLIKSQVRILKKECILCSGVRRNLFGRFRFLSLRMAKAQLFQGHGGMLPPGKLLENYTKNNHFLAFHDEV